MVAVYICIFALSSIFRQGRRRVGRRNRRSRRLFSGRQPRRLISSGVSCSAPPLRQLPRRSFWRVSSARVMREAPFAVGDGGRSSDNAALAGLLRPAASGVRRLRRQQRLQNRLLGLASWTRGQRTRTSTGCRTRCSVRVRTC